VYNDTENNCVLGDKQVLPLSFLYIHICVHLYSSIDDLVVEKLQSLKDLVDLESIFSMLYNKCLIQCSKLELSTVYYVMVDYIVNCRYVYSK
jgi:hypothetical protein